MRRRWLQSGRRARPSAQAGFSLLEVLVAFSIMALALGVLYSAVGGGLRNLLEAQRQTDALLLGQSLLSLHEGVPAAGLSLSGKDPSGVDWHIRSVPAALSMRDEAPESWPLRRLEIHLFWDSRGQRRQYVLATLLPEIREQGAEP